MASNTAPAKKGKGGKKSTPKNTRQYDNGLERLYARVSPEVKAIIDQAAREDDRSTMNYVERLLNNHAKSLLKKKGK